MKREIKFNSFYSSSNYTKNLDKLFADYELFRQKHFSRQCIALLKEDYPESEILLTHSATGALEMIPLVLDIKEGDEIILPSYTFVSTANAFALRGAKLVFVDIELNSLGIDPKLVEEAITEKTKAIVCVHYAGHACQIESLQEIAKKNQLYLIEDAAMAFGSKFKGKALGSFGDFGVVSFDVTKHLSASQGGMLLVNHHNKLQEAMEIYHTGTNRGAFEKGDVPYYEWVNLGSKYQMPETNAAILEVQLKAQKGILTHQASLSKLYFNQLKPLIDIGIVLGNENQMSKNFHEFYLICRTETERIKLLQFLHENGVEALFHYIPVHSSKFGKKYRALMPNNCTEKLAETLLRLPLHQDLKEEDIYYVCSLIIKFFQHG